MKEVFEQKFTLRVDEIDFKNKVKIESIFEYLQEAATLHSINLGFDKNYMDEHYSFWVLSRVSLEIFDYAGFEEEIRVKTWPSGNKKFLFGRDYIITNTSNEKIMEASSIWAVMNKQTRSLDLNPKFVNYINVENQGSLITTKKVFFDEEENYVSKIKEIVYSDLDVNKHVNNTTFIKWMFDLLDIDFLSSHQAKRIDINYLNEIKPNTILRLEYYTKDNITYFRGINDELTFYNSSITWG